MGLECLEIPSLRVSLADVTEFESVDREESREVFSPTQWVSRPSSINQTQLNPQLELDEGL